MTNGLSKYANAWRVAVRMVRRSTGSRINKPPFANFIRGVVKNKGVKDLEETVYIKENVAKIYENSIVAGFHSSPALLPPPHSGLFHFRVKAGK